MSRPSTGQLVALGEYLDHKYPPTVSDLLRAFDDVLHTDGHPALDDISAITGSRYRSTVTAHIGGYLPFVRWATHLGLAFQRTQQRDGFVLSARGPVRAGHLDLQVHLICSPDGIPT